METNTLSIRVETDDPSEASKLARELSDCIRESTPDVEVSLKRDDPEAQDLGTVIQVVAPQVRGMLDALPPYVHGAVAGTKFTLETLHAVVIAIHLWKERRPRKVLVVETPAGKLRIDREAPAADLVEEIHSLITRSEGGQTGD